MCNWYELIDMVNGWLNMDFTLLAFDAGSMTVNGILIVPEVIAAYNQL